MIKITDWLWTDKVHNEALLKQGWQNYQIVDHGQHYSLSLVKDSGGIREVEKIAERIESMDRAIELMHDHDNDTHSGVGAAFIFSAASIVALIIITVYLGGRL